MRVGSVNLSLFCFLLSPAAVNDGCDRCRSHSDVHALRTLMRALVDYAQSVRAQMRRTQLAAAAQLAHQTH